MDDGGSALKNRVSAGVLAPARGSGRRRSPAPHHLRRRAVALLVLAAVILAAGIWIGSHGGAATHRPALSVEHGFFDRIATLAGNGQGSFAAAQRAAEAGAINRTLAYTPYVRIAGAQHRELALTFDDGPGPYTPAMLAVLRRAGVPATFFEVGIEERYFHASTSEIVSRGDVIGDHTDTHAPMSTLTTSQQRAQLLEQAAAIGAYGAPFPRLFRPPYGLWNATTLRLLRRYRMLMVLWTVDTSDYRLPGVRAIVHAAVAGARPGAIILLHDAGGNRLQTVEALPRIIKDLRARGYKLVTVPRLLLDNPPPRNQQISAVLGTGG
ncbi:MAG: polysaccharide deacetylase family protein [Solirubrobacteraceae bacterium]